MTKFPFVNQEEFPEEPIEKTFGEEEEKEEEKEKDEEEEEEKSEEIE